LIKLKHIIHGAVVSEVVLSKGEFTIGRNHGNNLQLDDGEVSGEHAVITLRPNEYLPETFDMTIRDLNSTNGTYVNNAVVKEQELRHGDMITISGYEYRLFDDQSHVGTQTEYSLPGEL
jgi:pSer/pThr/pTyr-binding forkhead associated (FHA) protein